MNCICDGRGQKLNAECRDEHPVWELQWSGRIALALNLH